MSKLKEQSLQLIKIAFAVLILGVSINMFLGPHHIAAGGVSGLGILLEIVLNIDRAVVVFALNVVMLILAAIFLGRKVFMNILYGSLMFPVALGIVPEIMVAQDRMLSMIFGSIIFGIGVAILYKIQASSGGTTIPPLIFEKYFHLNTSLGLLFSDALIVCFSLYVFGMEEFLFAIMSIAITSIVMMYIETGTNRKKAVMFVSDVATEKFRGKLQTVLPADLTLFDVRSCETPTNQEMILLVVSDKNYPKTKEIIQTIDPKAFIITYNVAEVSGLGFTYHPIQ
ncbi:YitT family protein [Vagococcus elongatus]|uniref:DUF2179 domain-containing protein n=1 Tax=Vagococcus elongatus TaxID=180344 RepID=A0A430B125_9ENTE|nr:YitT family protein [Vagococcus elongatus]RSU14016.1 hypothetical protein CBF29_03795 [Vagococcus elongatus]